MTNKDQKSILVVDDDKITQHLLKVQLAKHNYRILFADDGFRALEMIGAELPDLVLLDLIMPGMNGFELCRRIRKKFNPEILPIVIVTAKKHLDDLVEGFKAGANDYLAKPYLAEELQARVQMHLRMKDIFATLKENQRLRWEIEQKEISEQEVRLTQRRLSRILDNAHEAILSVNEIGQILYLNRALEQLLGIQSQTTIGHSVQSIISAGDSDDLWDRSIPFAVPNINMADGAVRQTIHFKKPNGQVFSSQAFISLFELDEESVYVISISGPDADYSALSVNEHPLPTPKLIAELNRNRKRIRDLENSLNDFSALDQEKRPSLLHELKKIDSALDNLARSFIEDAGSATARELSIDVMVLAIQYWEDTTNRTKADLARKSRVWKVYYEQDGRERTQTLDKYLSSETLPQYPRYKKIIQTADFVLTFCKPSTAIRQKLELSLAKLQALI